MLLGFREAKRRRGRSGRFLGIIIGSARPEKRYLFPATGLFALTAGLEDMPREKKKKEKFLKKKGQFGDEFAWLLILGLWAAGIFIASSVPGSGEYYWNLQTFFERKGAHVFEFFVLAYLVWKVADFQRISFKGKIYFVFFASFFYAVSDEVHQLFVFGREGKALDVGIDLIGILSFILLIRLIKRMFSIEKPPI